MDINACKEDQKLLKTRSFFYRCATLNEKTFSCVAMTKLFLGELKRGYFSLEKIRPAPGYAFLS